MDIIQKVRANKVNGQKVVTIPKESDIDAGDYVKITKVDMTKIE